MHVCWVVVFEKLKRHTNARAHKKNPALCIGTDAAFFETS